MPTRWKATPDKITDSLSTALLLWKADPDAARQLLNGGSLRTDAYGLSGEDWADLKEIKLWSKQREIVRSVRENRHTAVPSCHGAGKTFIAAYIAVQTVLAHEPGEVFVVTTAPTGAQVKILLWREMNRFHAKYARAYGHMNQVEWWNGLNEIVAIGRKPSEYDEAAFQGIHAPMVLVLFDEAAGIPSALWDAAEGLMTSEQSRFLAIGNPDDGSSRFARVCEPDSGWNVIRIDGYDTPAFTEECSVCALAGAECACPGGPTPYPEPMMRSLLSVLWVDERRDRWGEESPLFEARVRGRFPTHSEDGVVPLGWVRQCQDADGIQYPETMLTPVELGVDVGGGGDKTVIRERRGILVGRSWELNSSDSEVVANGILRAIRDSGATRVKVDETGIGWGVVGSLRRMQREGLHNAEIVGVNFGSKAADATQFANTRAELWWEVGRELSRTGGWDLTYVDDDVIAQLTSTRYKTDAVGRILCEKKDEVIKRLGRSPDDADALLLAFYGAKNRAVASVYSG